jgi:hypothetical protein
MSNAIVMLDWVIIRYVSLLCIGMSTVFNLITLWKSLSMKFCGIPSNTIVTMWKIQMRQNRKKTEKIMSNCHLKLSQRLFCFWFFLWEPNRMHHFRQFSLWWRLGCWNITSRLFCFAVLVRFCGPEFQLLSFQWAKQINNSRPFLVECELWNRTQKKFHTFVAHPKYKFLHFLHNKTDLYFCCSFCVLLYYK